MRRKQNLLLFSSYLSVTFGLGTLTDSWSSGRYPILVLYDAEHTQLDLLAGLRAMDQVP